MIITYHCDNNHCDDIYDCIQVVIIASHCDDLYDDCIQVVIMASHCDDLYDDCIQVGCHRVNSLDELGRN